MCVCVRERERMRERKEGSFDQTVFLCEGEKDPKCVCVKEKESKWVSSNERVTEK